MYRRSSDPIPDMRFCSQCDNMYYLKLAGEDADDTTSNTLMYYCRHCGHEDAAAGIEGGCVLETDIHSQKQQYAQAVNAYTRTDPTLPRTRSIKCPDPNCASNHEGGDQEVVYLRYDDVSMKYLYICRTCGTMWKTSDSE